MPDTQNNKKKADDTFIAYKADQENAYISGLIRGCRKAIVPQGLKRIADSAFSWSSITAVDIPESVTEIGNRAFRSCNWLTEIIIPTSVSKIGNYAFADCGALKSIIIPDSVKIIGYHAFDDCKNLENIILPAANR